MNVFRIVLCAFGKHPGSWSYPGVRCEISRTCEFCGKAERRGAHSWGQFAYAEAGRCEQVRRCGRCGTEGTRTLHEWGPWRYLSNEMNSRQGRRCRRCHETERSSPTMR